MKKLLRIMFVALLLASLFPLGALSVKTQTQTGPATDTIIFKAIDTQLAAEALKKGLIDYYIYGLTPTEAEALEDYPNVTMIYAPVGLVDIGINPAPAPEGELNPLAIREVRFALNYLMDRDYIVTQIYKGFAAPMVCFLSSYDPDYVTIYDVIAKYDFKYDPTVAAAIINEAMTKAGATKVEGKWYYNGKPVTLKFIIRIEDERREIGDTFASALESVGFTIERDYMSFGQAIPIVYGTDPAKFEWHLYTEGWGKGALDKYDSGTINQFGAPWYGWIPGYQEAGWWQYENATIDDLGKRIYMGNFTTKEERNELYKKATEMIIQESTRIWAATRLEIHPARTEVKGITGDLGTGLRSPLNIREVYVPGKSTVTVGHLHVHTEGSVWNPVGGHDDVYSIDIWHAVYDPVVWRHPFSGMPIPFRWGYEVKTAGPSGTLSVPADAYMWNATENKWEPVGSEVTATSLVTYDLSKYIGTKWHHGQTITWGDVLYAIAQQFELAYDEQKSSIEPSIAAMLKEILAPFKGFRIVGDKLEVYVDYWHFSDDYIADYTSVIMGSGHYPWEVLAAMNKVVFEDKAAMFSESASDSFGVPWLSVNLPAHASMVNDALDRLNFSELKGIFTVGNKVYASSSEMAERISATHQWFNEHNHIVISDGPFYLNKFDAAADYAEIKAFRDPTYPFKKGDWYYGMPTSPEITKIGIPTVVPGGAASFVIEVSGPPPLGVKYLIRNPVTGKILATGDAEAITASKFIIRLTPEQTKAMEPGLYELTTAAYSETVAFVGTSKSYFDVFNVLPLESSFQEVGTAISTQLTSATQSLEASISSLSSSVNNLTMMMAVIAVLVIIDIAVTLMRKSK